jgi:E3 ubiquitin-protein ligase EDD1
MGYAGAERIRRIAGAGVRCSIVSESGRIGTWLDETLSHAASRLEHQAREFSEFGGERVTSLHVCSLYTVARLDNGSIYWWYVRRDEIFLIYYIFSLLFATGEYYR